MKNNSARTRLAIDNLVFTSVQDMQSGLWTYGIKDLELLKKAHKRVTKYGEKTKAKILAAKIRQLEKRKAEEVITATVKVDSIELNIEVE